MNNNNSSNISFFRSQRFTFLRLFMALALVPVILLGVITYWQATVNLNRTTDLNMGQLGNVQNQRIPDWLQNLKSQVEWLSKDDGITTMDADEATSSILAFSETSPAAAVHAGNGHHGHNGHSRMKTF